MRQTGKADASLPHRRRTRARIHYPGFVPSLTARITAGLAALFSALLLASCSTHSDTNARRTSADDKPVITGEPAGYNSADVTFANNLTPLEEQGIKMSQLAPDHSTNSELVAFAAKTAAALDMDTQVLKALQTQWKEGWDSPTGAGGPSITASFTIDDATLAKLNSLHGPDFDAPWLQSMIGLDHGAIDMANAEIANGKNVDAIDLAKQIVKARQAEIGQVQQLRQALPG